MNRGASYGGGQSLLGYLFGSEEPPSQPTVTRRGKKALPTTDHKLPPPSQTISNNYHSVGGQNTNNFITGRPTTKVQSVPGGDSSLAYFFDDK